MRLAAAGLAALALVAAATACTGPPVRVQRVPLAGSFGQVGADALSPKRISEASRIVLRRHGLSALFERRPAAALAELRATVVAGAPQSGGRDAIFTLAELSFVHGSRRNDRRHLLAAALYSYTFALSAGEMGVASVFDPRFRAACDLYNAGLIAAFRRTDGAEVALESGVRELPFGSLEIELDEASLMWAGRRLVGFVPTSELQVEGLRNLYRRPGLGMPLAARTEATAAAQRDAARALVAETVRVPVTAVLRLSEPRTQIARVHLRARLEVHAADETETFSLEDGSRVPLEQEPSAALAVGLAESRFWERELPGLFGGLLPGGRATQLAAGKPYRPGEIPVVFVHGTGSSPARWADMVNDLEADTEIRRRFQFWYFSYDSGNPIAFSAYHLRRSLEAARKSLASAGGDPCLDRMVVIGHSQGGLLTKMVAIDSGDRFWRHISDQPFAEARLQPSTRELLGRALFVEPLPFVERVVFIATPHRGSFLAGPQLVRRLAARLIRLPKDLLDVSADLVGLVDDPSSRLSLERLPTSIDNMSPGNPFIQALAEIPVAPTVAAHSIIPVRGDGPLESGDDGVVRYRSAHVDGVESEIVVRSGHSTQGHPKTIGEVARILRRHAEAGCRAR